MHHVYMDKLEKDLEYVREQLEDLETGISSTAAMVSLSVCHRFIYKCWNTHSFGPDQRSFRSLRELENIIAHRNRYHLCAPVLRDCEFPIPLSCSGHKAKKINS